MSWLNYHHLYYFWTIAHEGGIAKASRKLRLGQPTLSTQLKNLEESLGRPLFERRNRQLVLTDYGRVALEYADEIFRLGCEMVEALHDRLSPGKTHVTIGALDSVPKSIVMKLTQSVFATGEATVSVLEGRGDSLLRELQAHRLDVIISNSPPVVGEEERFYFKSISKIPVIICGAKQFLPLRKGFPESLKNQPFVMPTLHSKLRHDVDHYFGLAGVSVDTVAEAQDTMLQKMLAVAGAGLTPIAEPAAEEFMVDKKLFEIGRLEGVFEEIWLATASRKIENPVASKVVKNFTL